VASIDVYIGYASGGVTDSLFVPLLIGAAAGWDRFAFSQGLRAWRGPICMGLAMAVKQTPWLIVPFVLAGIARESWPAHGWRQALRDCLRYAFIALAYLATAPSAWLRGILTPLTSHSVPAGQGLISLSLSLTIGGGSLLAYNIAAAVVLTALLACYVTTYPALKAAAFLLPSIALFFADRSFGSYLVMLIPAALVAAATVRQRVEAARWRLWKWVLAGAGMASCGAVAAALTAASPLTMSVESVHTTGQLATVGQVQLAVANNTGKSVRPAFTIQEGTQLTYFWLRVAGPAVLGPHQRAEYTIQAPNSFAMPSIATGFQVLAFAGSPASVSRSGPYLASTWRVVLQPNTVNTPVPVGQEITVRAAIVNRLDQPIRVANVPVYLGQVIYAQQGLQYSQAYINRGLAGQTPVEALTAADGVATFTIHSPVSGSDPVYFEANLVNSSLFYPYGYSPILTVRFGS
jgi:hypothetical protein